MKLFSIIEGTQESLARLGLDYVDIIFAHRPDSNGMSLPMSP
jgi:aryl-alcohol dehydrogenase-like predicted oxidoreductase